MPGGVAGTFGEIVHIWIENGDEYIDLESGAGRMCAVPCGAARAGRVEPVRENRRGPDIPLIMDSLERR